MKRRFDLTADPVSPASLPENLEGREAEIIVVTPTIARRLMMAQFPNARRDDLACWETVERVFPCKLCSYPVVLVKVGRETWLLDAVVNQLRSGEYHKVWIADVVNGDHHCAGACQ